MKNHPLVPDDIEQNYDVRERRDGLAILAAVRPVEWAEMLQVLRGFKLLRSDIVNPGGAKSDIAKKIDGHFTKFGWLEKQFDTKIVVDKTEYHTPTHKVDCYKNRWRWKWNGTTRILSSTGISITFVCCLSCARLKLVSS
jgi:hypothetical protein